jgi:hypothetical protein
LKTGSMTPGLAAFGLFCGVALSFWALPAAGEEGGSGHYFPGSMASFMDAVSPTPAFIVRYNQIYYSGSVGAKKAIPIAGSRHLDCMLRRGEKASPYSGARMVTARFFRTSIGATACR